MTAVWPIDSKPVTFFATLSNSILNWVTFEKEVFDLMFNLESDEMTTFLCDKLK